MSELSTSATLILEVKNEEGIYIRLAYKIARLAGQYAETEIAIIRKNKIINAKSIMGIMTLKANKGTRLIIAAKGGNAQKSC